MKAKSTTKQEPAKKPAAVTVASYAKNLAPEFRAICTKLRNEIEAAMPDATSRVWHGSPVWFLDEIPVVGYNATKTTVNLLFWNGQVFNEPTMKPVGKYKAAQFLFAEVADVNEKLVRRCLKNRKALMWDPKSLRKQV